MSNLTSFQEQQEITIQRARQAHPDDERLVESSGNTVIRDEAFTVACEILGEAA
jgi:hypothetical protein